MMHFFKQYLGYPHVAADFLRQHLPAEVVQLLDLTQLQLQEGGVLMETMADEWIEQGKAIGLREGEQKGEINGRVQARREMILYLLQRRFPDNEVLWQIFEKQLALISDEKALNQLVDIALEVIVLPDFAMKLQAFIPPTKPMPEGGA